jgi:hypothetical protein
LGSGSDISTFTDLLVGGDARFFLGSGIDALTVTTATVTGDVQIDAGADNDSVTIDALTADDLFIQLASGDDELEISGSTVGQVDIFGGSGAGDVFVDAGGNAFVDIDLSSIGLP